MMQPLNFTPKAVEQFGGFDNTATGFARLGFRYLREKLEQAEVFVLPDHGQLLDRSKPRPEVPGIVLRPPFPVVALEYLSPRGTGRVTPGYTDAPSSKRIALAWEWKNDLPAAFGPGGWRNLDEGVVVASICFFDEHRAWMPVGAAIHMPFEGEWTDRDGRIEPFVSAAVKSGQLSAAQVNARVFPGDLVPILPEVVQQLFQALGPDGAFNNLGADLMDEANAYTDLCYALACGNVRTQRHLAPSKLNKGRERHGAQPLKDFHVLQLADAAHGDETGGFGGGPKRAHLRRGHIRHLRHLGPDRITWVNASMVRGRADGFADKSYAVGARA